MVLQAVLARKQVVLGVLSVLVAIGSLAGCGDDADSGTDSDASTLLDAATSNDSSTAEDAAVTDTGADDDASSAEDAAVADTGAEMDSAVAAGGDCNLVFSMSTANTLDSTMPVTTKCTAVIYTKAGVVEQVNFGAEDTVGSTTRMFMIDWFEAQRTTGAEVDFAVPFDFMAMTGAHASYMELGTDSPLWAADMGKIKLESVNGDDYVVTLTNVHFAADNSGPVPGTASGDFIVNGTITATATTVNTP